MAVTVAGVSCQRELVAPGQCPETCPGGSPRVFDTVLTATPGVDSTFVGYVLPGEGPALLVSRGLPGIEARAVIKFLPLADSVLVGDTLRAFTVDSVGFRLGLVARDSTVPGLQIKLYRIPSSTDSSVAFLDLVPYLVDSTLIGTVTVDDSVATGPFRLVVSDSAKLDLLRLAPADSGVMAIAVSMSAAQATGIRIGSQSTAGLGPLWQTFATFTDITDTTLKEQTLTRIATFNTFVTKSPPVFNDSVLTVGGAPSARPLIRFSLPPFLGSSDSVQIVRATLQLFPVKPIPGLPGDSAVIRVRGVLSDLGSKSPRCNFTPGSPCGSAVITRFAQQELVVGSSDTVQIEIEELVRGWQGDNGAARALFLDLGPEAASFTRPEFGSSRISGFEPQILLTYVLPFPFDER